MLNDPAIEKHDRECSKSSEEVICDLQRQIRQKDSNAKKDKAVYEQRVELLELQIKESKDREESMRRMHDTMIAALKHSNADTNHTPKELEITNELHQKECEEIKERHAEVVTSLERQISELKKQLSDSEANNKLLIKKLEDAERATEIKEKLNEGKVKELNDCIRKLEEDKLASKEAAELDMKAKMQNQDIIIDKIKEEHAKELEKQKAQSDSDLKDIKYIHEQEIASCESRIEKAYLELKAVQAQKEANTNMHMQDMQGKYLIEIQELNAHLEAFKRQSYEELASLKGQRDDAYKKIEALERATKNAGKGMQMLPDKGIKGAKGMKGKPSLDPMDGVHQELSKLKKQCADLKSYITKLEANERKLKSVVAQKDSELESERENFTKALHEEKQEIREPRSPVDQAKPIKVTCSTNKKKDEKGSTARKKEATQFEFTEDGENMHADKKAYTPLCEGSLPLREAPANAQKIETSSNISPTMGRNPQNYVIKGCESKSEDKSTLTKKLRETEEILQSMTAKMGQLQGQRDRVQSELDKVNEELKHTKEFQEKAEHKKTETEINLKDEIKHLISMLVHTKEKITESVEGTYAITIGKKRAQRSISINESASKNAAIRIANVQGKRPMGNSKRDEKTLQALSKDNPRKLAVAQSVTHLPQTKAALDKVEQRKEACGESKIEIIDETDLCDYQEAEIDERDSSASKNVPLK